MSATDTVLAVRQLRKTFDGVPAVDDVSFDLMQGETAALLGPSGCGKTSTLRIIAGFTSPDQGSVAMLGRDVTRKRPYERNIGILFQDYALFPHMTVAENIAFGPQHRGLSKSDIKERVERYLDLVHMGNYRDRHPTNLSGGQQQRVALARALATEPEILLLDEPLSALDAKMRESLRTELKQILAQTGVTTIIVTHDQEEALSLADRVMVMHRGRILQDAAPRDIYEKPASRFVAEFVGRSNWLPGKIYGKGNSAVFHGPGDIRLPAPGHLSVDQEILCFVRPEKISLAERGAPLPSGLISLDGTVRDVIFLGQDTEVTADVSGNLITALIRDSKVDFLRLGTPVHLRFAAGDLGYVKD
ncbi:putative spermidine/putrescine transport system ATP-binding protein/putrescine transport system ATP-binding protein [Rhodoligotrophos appendicifer]|uniref:ABC transporter ATP-binding protein n=1 Tax=Rhodoligotrophos appendicifer TaxID=987056 RepID=UPI001185B94F|nr:ABC transporter ATP-binding protein [Rhodoligotrophos appendicifer]